MSDEPVMTPITPEEGGGVPPKVEPFGAAAPAAPAPAAAPASGVSTIKLKPVIRKPMIRKPTIGGTPKPPAATPVAAHTAERVLTLPMYADLPLETVDRICDIILKP